MKVAYINMLNSPNVHEQLTVIELEIEPPLVVCVTGFGTSNYRWTLSETQQDQPCQGTLEGVFGKMPLDGWAAAQSFGPGGAMVEETTFAHMVLNAIHNG